MNNESILINKDQEKKDGNASLDILFLNDNFLESVGGEQESTRIILEGIKNKYRVGVICPGEITNPISSIEYFYMTKRTRIKHLVKHPFEFLSYVRNVKKVLNTEKPRVIHTQSQVSYIVVSFLKKFKLVSNESIFIHTERGLYVKYNFIFKKLFLYCSNNLDILVTTTQFNRNLWENAARRSHCDLKYRIIENTAGKSFEDYNELYISSKKEYITVGFIGRYADWKNWPLAVEISKKLYKLLGNKVKIIMVMGCLDDNSIKEAKNIFNELDDILGESFEGNINLKLEDIERLYYNLDFFILTSNKNCESFGRTLVEAMSRKTIVLSTDAGGTREVIGNDELILKTADEFVDKIMFYHGNKELAENEVERGFKRVREVYSLNNNISKHIEMYDEFLEK